MHVIFLIFFLIFFFAAESYSGEDLGSRDYPDSSSVDRPGSATTQPTGSIGNHNNNNNSTTNKNNNNIMNTSRTPASKGLREQGTTGLGATTAAGGAAGGGGGIVFPSTTTVIMKEALGTGPSAHPLELPLEN